jgi:hypothetical protein
MKQTAVEWLVEEMFKQGYLNDKPMTVANINYFANIAKEMEKTEKLKNQLFRGKVSEIIGWSKVIELMKECNETFKSE